MEKRVVALVPMRHHSERVPGKNYRSFAGKPLYHHIINSLLSCPLIHQVVVDTDSPIIMEDTSEHFPQVQVIERPEHLRADTIPMNDVLLNEVKMVEADFYLQTHSTNPLLRSETISQAIEMFLNNPTTVDIVITTYNRPKLLQETLESVAAQTYPHWLCWIAEDGETKKHGCH